MSCRRKRDRVFVLQHYDTTIVRLRKRLLPLATRPASPRPPAGPAAPARVPVPRGSSARPKTGCQTVPKQANSCQIAPRVPGSWPRATDSAAFPGPKHIRRLTYIHTAAVVVNYRVTMTRGLPTTFPPLTRRFSCAGGPRAARVRIKVGGPLARVLKN